MKQINFVLRVAVACLVFPLMNTWAHEVHSHSAPVTKMTDAQSIEHAMKSLFDKPNAPLKVVPVSVEGAYAVAGWIQNDRGGRALLKRENGKWSIQVCGGDGLKEVASLTMAGMDKTSANRLAQKIAMAEKQMTADQVKKLAMFEGVVKVGAGAHDPHTTHHGHAAHSK